MKRTLLTILSVISDALLLSAGTLPGQACAEPECRDTIRVADTVWVAPPARQVSRPAGHAQRTAGSADPVLSDTFDRGIGKATALFIPKGTLAFGLTASYDSYDFGNAADDVGYKMLFSLINGLDASMTSFGIAPHVSYFFADNTSVGLRFDYGKSDMGIGNADLSLGDALSFSVRDMYYIQQSYSGSLTLRHYMSIADSRRFAIFIEGRGTLGYGQSKTYRKEGDDKYGTYQDISKASLSLVPGVVCFMMDNAAFEVSVGVLGFDHQRVKQITNQVEVSEMRSSGANFKVNLLSINFGMSFYIYPKRNR